MSDPHKSDESISKGSLGSKFQFHSNFKMYIPLANSSEPDQTPRSVASDMVLHCLPMSYKKDVILKWAIYVDLYHPYQLKHEISCIVQGLHRCRWYKIVIPCLSSCT